MTVFGGVIVAVAFPLVTSAVGRVLIALAARRAPGRANAPLYLAGPVDHLRIAAVLAYENDLLVNLSADLPTELAGRAWRVVADAGGRTRVERWLEDGTALRAYCTAAGAIMLADRGWGGNVACEPAMAVS